VYHIGKLKQGYGRVGQLQAHRVAWERVNGPIPSGMVIDHVCHEPRTCRGGDACPHRACVNPDHLALSTNAANCSARRSSISRRGELLTHCPNGHAYTPENSAYTKTGALYCRTCKREKNRARGAGKPTALCLARGHLRQPFRSADGKERCRICTDASARLARSFRHRTASEPAQLDETA
jgi:hypothetical protein